MENEFGRKIKTIRKSRGLTQQEFADSLGYAHKSTINKIESGQEDMSYQKILVLLKEYMLDARDLFDTSKKDIDNLNQLIGETKKPRHDTCIIYIHGLYGNSEEASLYSFYSKKYDVIGLDYKDGNPWEVKEKLVKEYEMISSRYKEVYVIANSIGAFYTYNYLADFKIKTAFFISPFVSMKKMIEDVMKKHNVSLERLEKEKFVFLDDGEILSYDFYKSLCHKDNWNIKTHILYGEKDKMVDHQSIFDFVSNHNCSLTIMKNGEHYFHTPGQLKFIKKWINEYLK